MTKTADSLEAASVTPQDAKHPLGLGLDNFMKDLTINTTSAFVAAQQAVSSFEKLPDTASRTFIYTGNITNVSPIVGLMDLGIGKSATAHIIQCAAEAYKDKGYKYVPPCSPLRVIVSNEMNPLTTSRFYYADERKADGAAVYGAIDGPAHAKFYTELAGGKSQGPWQQTFVKDVGYKKF